MAPMLQVEDLARTYRGPSGPVAALAGVTLEVAAGEFVAVQGPSGCGKTTLLLASGGLLVPDRGHVRVGGEDLYALDASERARVRAERIGFVFQQFHLIPYLSVIDNVLAPSLAVRRPGARDRARELVRRFGLEERAHHVPAELSTGEKQRTAMARALLNEPRLLLADEPTGNLDEANAEPVLDELGRFAAGGGAVLLVTHERAAAERATRRVRLEAGQIVSTDRTEEAQRA